MSHTVVTTHIQRLIHRSLMLAKAADQTPAGKLVEIHAWLEGTRIDHERKPIPVEHVLQKAAADLRHAAEELEAERLSVLGWAQA